MRYRCYIELNLVEIRKQARSAVPVIQSGRKATLIGVLLVAMACILASPAQAGYITTTIQVPGDLGTVGAGIDGTGRVLGYGFFGDGAGTIFVRGFLWQRAATLFGVPGTNTQPTPSPAAPWPPRSPSPPAATSPP